MPGSLYSRLNLFLLGSRGRGWFLSGLRIEKQKGVMAARREKCSRSHPRWGGSAVAPPETTTANRRTQNDRGNRRAMRSILSASGSSFGHAPALPAEEIRVPSRLLARAWPSSLKRWRVLYVFCWQQAEASYRHNLRISLLQRRGRVALSASNQQSTRRGTIFTANSNVIPDDGMGGNFERSYCSSLNPE